MYLSGEKSMSCIFQIKVYGELDNNRYPITFFIYENKGVYCVTCDIFGHSIQCCKFRSKQEALNFVRTSMKMAMRNSFLYRICTGCLENVYLPLIQCDDCRDIFSLDSTIHVNFNISNI